MAFLAHTFLFWWILIVVVILRSFRSASSHDEEFESSAGRTTESIAQRDHPGTWHKCPHNIASGGHVA